MACLGLGIVCVTRLVHGFEDYKILFFFYSVEMVTDSKIEVLLVLLSYFRVLVDVL